MSGVLWPPERGRWPACFDQAVACDSWEVAGLGIQKALQKCLLLVGPWSVWRQ